MQHFCTHCERFVDADRRVGVDFAIGSGSPLLCIICPFCGTPSLNIATLYERTTDDPDFLLDDFSYIPETSWDKLMAEVRGASPELRAAFERVSKKVAQRMILTSTGYGPDIAGPFLRPRFFNRERS